ncbi:hypothetical protein PPK16_gp68 [Bacillus phage 049ML001]|uniref:Uncharacterized protein n=1 Tax=Bacillus phage 049ML001 TaxID=2601660 RepID=A0A5P8PJX6_9CAUD|nr:hypothetical protein PPK16_gp68 [Bacillus phage 049ML001]QFR56370.1 hypothetical protein 049ML001_68 [Bacillus phage 049ML001]QFR56453.1 hypothetical protein 049ML003_70 [Bacillus phage 049ML003]
MMHLIVAAVIGLPILAAFMGAALYEMRGNKNEH